MIFSVASREMRDSLLHQRFEEIGDFGDNIVIPRQWQMRGNGNKLSTRQKEGIAWSKWLKRKFTEFNPSFGLSQTFTRGVNKLGGRYHGDKERPKEEFFRITKGRVYFTG